MAKYFTKIFEHQCSGDHEMLGITPTPPAWQHVLSPLNYVSSTHDRNLNFVYNNFRAHMFLFVLRDNFKQFLGLTLSLHSGISSGRTLGTIWDAKDQTQTGYV